MSGGVRDAASPPIRVLLVDDDPMVCSGLELMLSQSADLTVAGAVHDGDEVVPAIHAHRPHVVLMDVRMHRQDGIVATATIQRMPDPPKVIVLTTFDHDDVLHRALLAGADGFLLKTASPTEILRAVRQVADGDGALSPASTRQLLQQVRRDSGDRGRHEAAREMAGLSEREREVLVAVAKGLTNSQVGRRLYISEATVKTHLSSALAKLGRTRIEAAILADRAGLLA